MLKGNRLLCLTLLPIFMTPSTIKPFHNSAWQHIENRIDDNEMVQMGDYRLRKLQEQYEKDKTESAKKKAEEEAKKQKELDQQQKSEPEWKEFILTFYSSSISENSKAGAVTCQGKKLQPYMIANNIFSLGTQIYLEGYGTKIVADRGSSKHFNTSDRLDVFIEKEPNESDRQYLKRVNGYGIQRVKGYVVK